MFPKVLFLLSICCFSLCAEEKFVEVNGAKLYCKTMGKGNPVVLVHGGPGFSQGYLFPQMEELSKSCLLIAYDQRGSGKSTGALSKETVTIAQFVEDLDAVRKSFGYEKISLVGHSWGAHLATEYALAHPENVDKLVLSNPPPVSSKEFALLIEEWTRRMAPYLPELQTIKESEAYKKGEIEAVAKHSYVIFQTYCFEKGDVDKLNLKLEPESALRGIQVHEFFNENFFCTTFDLHPRLKQLNVKTLLIHGDYDPIPQATVESMHQDIQGSQYVLIQNCGHFPYIEKPEIFFKVVNEFFNTAT